MSKDPAVLFYTSDFLSGTSFFTDEQKGQYITLLCQQHQLGKIPKNHMIIICKSHDNPVIKKFTLKDGFYYNPRMRLESEKRATYCASRGKNRKGHFKEKSYENHMENENDNGNGNVDIIKKDGIVKGRKRKFIKPTIEQVKQYCLKIKSKVDPDFFWHNYESTGWIKANGQPVLNWKSTIRTWEIRNKRAEQKSQRGPGLTPEEMRLAH